jgi:hypothetical protein
MAHEADLVAALGSIVLVSANSIDPHEAVITSPELLEGRGAVASDEKQVVLRSDED